ncbi:hypothetical protein GCM10007363_03230 [Pseudomonas fluvialis]|uniref:Uncharacterized protein n=1 Tax=Pseudomonas fluvialis TaxID=1793966 RepID=A0ABQ2ADB5_9PSED|nr:hypothetical protein GCM10007363_03230 [Pseudomonas fluvialis]
MLAFDAQGAATGGIDCLASRQGQRQAKGGQFEQLGHAALSFMNLPSMLVVRPGDAKRHIPAALNKLQKTTTL